MTVVLEASAFPAFAFGESGAETVLAALPDAVMSGINPAEVATRLIDKAGDAEAALADLPGHGVTILPLDEPLALAAAAQCPATRAWGLSLQDRACLALVQRLGVPVLTADRAWMWPDMGVTVQVIR